MQIRGYKIRGYKILAIVLSMMLFVVGCVKDGGQPAKNQQGGEKQAETVGSAEPPAPTKLTVYRLASGLGLDDFMAKEGWLMQQKFPNLQFDFILGGQQNTPEQLIAAGTPIDIILTANPVISRVSSVGLTMDLSDLIKKYNFDLNRLEPSTLEAVKKSAEGKLVGLPVTVHTNLLVYNKDIFDKFGVSYPTDKLTWDDIYELAQKLTRSDGGTQYYGFGFNFLIEARVNAYAHEFIDAKTGKTTYADDFWNKYFEQFGRFFKLPGYSPTDQAGLSRAGIVNLLKNHNIAMFEIQNNGFLQVAESGINFDFIKIPTYKDLPGVGESSTPDYMLLASSSKQKDAAFAAIVGALSDESQLGWSKRGNVSPLKSEAVKKAFASEVPSPELKGKNMQAMIPQNMAAPLTLDQNFDTISKFLDTAFNDSVTGKQDINTALRNAQEAADKALQEAAGK